MQLSRSFLNTKLLLLDVLCLFEVDWSEQALSRYICEPSRLGGRGGGTGAIGIDFCCTSFIASLVTEYGGGGLGGTFFLDNIDSNSFSIIA